MLDIKTCLWFHAEAEEAANFYVSLFPNSKIASVMRGGPGSPAIALGFVLDGRQQQGFTDAYSFVVTCETQADIDRYWTGVAKPRILASSATPFSCRRGGLCPACPGLPCFMRDLAH